jgi:SAM-dependent methyltransferase
MREAAYEGMGHHEAEHWWFVGRRRILQVALEKLSLPQGARILEVGAGTGGNIPLLQRFGQVTALEPNPRARTWIASKTGVAALDCALPDTVVLGERKFDLIAMFDVLEHIEDATGSLVALRAHLAHGGRLVVTVPAYRFLWSSHDVSLHHYRRYTRRSLSDTVSAAGLQTVCLRYFNTLLFPAVAAARLLLNAIGTNTVNEERMPPPAINAVLARIFASERHFVLPLSMPFGVSLLAVLKA